MIAMQSDVSILIAFAGGLLSFFSPCVLPLIPSYLSMLMGDYAEDKGKINLIFSSLLFISGFSLVFIALGLSASLLGQFLLKNLYILRKISGIAVFILGLHLSGLIRISFLYREKGLELKSRNRLLRPLIMGLALAFAWTPCIGPILSSILIYAGTREGLFQGGLLLAFYSLGFALPFFLAALFLEQALPRLKKINRYLPLLQKLAGLLLIILGLLIFTNY
ncbi:MAG: cytochrome c biogenesis CcdA family protein, partial [Halanaerobiales bacterium]